MTRGRDVRNARREGHVQSIQRNSDRAGIGYRERHRHILTTPKTRRAVSRAGRESAQYDAIRRRRNRRKRLSRSDVVLNLVSTRHVRRRQNCRGGCGCAFYLKTKRRNVAIRVIIHPRRIERIKLGQILIRIAIIHIHADRLELKDIGAPSGQNRWRE